MNGATDNTTIIFSRYACDKHGEHDSLMWMRKPDGEEVRLCMLCLADLLEKEGAFMKKVEGSDG